MGDILSLINDVIFVSLVNTTLQMTLLISLIALAIWLFRVKSAATRYSLWVFAAFAIIVLPLLTPFIPQMNFARSHSQGTAGHRPDYLMQKGIGGDVGELSKDSDSLTSMGAAKATVSKEADVSLINPVSIAYFIWCAGAFFMLCITIGAYRNLKKLKTSSPDVEYPAALKTLSRLRREMGIEKSVALKTSPDIYTPISLGIFSPAVILPNGVANGGSSSELEMILTHELAHIKRRDYLINIFQNMLRAIFFFHPLFYLMNRNLTREREHICDDWVIDVTQQRSGYAECIIGLLEKALYKPVSVPVTLAMAERKQDIPGRIDMIVDRERNITTRISRKALIAVFLIGCLALPIIGGIELARFAGARATSDERSIVFVRDFSIWIMDSKGANEKQLTVSDGRDYTPVPSPDGRQIAFSRRLDDENLADIYIMNPDGTNIKQLTDGPGDDGHPTWSPDGRRIAFHRIVWNRKGDNWEHKSSAIYVMDADGLNMNVLTEEGPIFFARSPAWSPNGSKIAFHEYEPALEPHRLWLMEEDGGNQELLHEWGDSPAWSPDGQKIAFNSTEAREKLWTFSEIYIMNADGTDVMKLTGPDLSGEESPSWSPDGEKIAFSALQDEKSYIYIMNVDGSDVQRITDAPEYEFWPNWTASLYVVESAGKLKATWGKIKRGLFGE